MTVSIYPTKRALPIWTPDGKCLERPGGLVRLHQLAGPATLSAAFLVTIVGRGVQPSLGGRCPEIVDELVLIFRQQRDYEISLHRVHEQRADKSSWRVQWKRQRGQKLA